ncbi:MAG: c-type cytochrome [Anaerolineae bacterium]
MSLWHKVRWKIAAVVGAGLFGLVMRFILALSPSAGRNLAAVLAGATLVWVVVDFIPLPALARSVVRFVIAAVAVWFAAPLMVGMPPGLRIHPVGAVIAIGVVSIGADLARVSPRLRANLIGATGLVAFAWVAGLLLGLPGRDIGMLIGSLVVGAALWIASDSIKLGATLNKLVKTLIVAAAVWFASGALGFPPVFQAYFVAFAALAFPFFVLLDARWSTEPPRRGGLAILIVFIVASVVLTAAGFLLPQFSTAAEQDKIARLQQSFLDRQADQRREEVRQQAEELGLVVVEPTPEGSAEGETVAESADPSQELIEKGKQAYDDYECYNCHKIGGKGGVKRRGPELDSVGLLMSYDALWAEILNPTASLSEGFEEEYDKVTMPDDFGERMSKSDIEAVTAYMVSLQSTDIQSPKAFFPGPEKPDKGEGPFYEIPLEYQRVVPQEWWTDETIIEEGKALYEGQVDSAVVCSACHGANGKPVMTGASDFTDIDMVESMGEVYWYWRIATGVPGTAMTPWESKLTREQIMKLMVYQNTFAYDGEPTDHEEMFYPPKAQR